MAKILVIENEKALRDDIADLLELEGHDVFVSSNGKEGLEKALQETPDLIISDIMMPRMDGFEMIKGLKQNPETSTIPVLFLTAKAERSDIRKGMTLGAEDYLTKPFTTDELIRAIDTMLQKQARLRERFITPLRTIQEAITHSLPHEFHTPLSGIIASGELLTMYSDELTSSQIKDLGKSILSSGQRLHRVIEHYLLFAQLEIIESSNTRLAEVRQSVTEFPRGTVESFVEDEGRRQKREKDLAVELKHSPPLKISREHFIYAFSELINNSFKFSAAGQEVSVTDGIENGCYALIFKDAGPGMTEEEIVNVGQHKQFRRTEYEQQGLGMGLTLAAKIARIYDGELQLTPGKEFGLVQKLLVPIKTEAA
ncbi:MAG: response regulator [Ardenticatenaceae bacterium]|nr:response regulator [Ardenticatenaceae bacterium]